MNALLVSTGIVALAEMGDKTQLLALLLTTQFRRPLPIIAGMFVATILNHAFAGAIGSWLTSVVSPNAMRWILGLSFLGMGAWTLIPDKLDDDQPATQRWGAFITTLVAFFLAEMGDKTQIATVALAARFDSLLAVVTGTTIGMMLANVPVVFFGEWLVKKIPVRVIHIIAAILFAVMGVMMLVLGR